VVLRLRRSTNQELAALLRDSQSDHLTYEPSGASLSGDASDGLSAQRWGTEVGGAEAFDRASEALHTWVVHRRANLTVATDGALAVGRNVAFCAPLTVGFIDASCRIVAVIDEPDRFGFAYGTLSIHPERGEESFIVTRTPTGARFDIQAVSAPAHRLARLVLPITHRLQHAAIRRYMTAMQDIAGA
jgi:uncharacterized protein (UPF0548 family)